MARAVKLYRSITQGLRIGNFGDELTIPLLQSLFGLEAQSVSLGDAELVCIGSILDAYSKKKAWRRWRDRLTGRSTKLDIWGAGFMLEDSNFIWPQKHVTVHAVRGELSAKRLPGFSGGIGDPGILSSRIFEPKKKQAFVGLIPHFVDEADIGKLDIPPHWNVIHPDNEVREVIEAISSCEIIVSSSLHGLIVADSLGIPCIWALTIRNLSGKSRYKFFDHSAARRKSFNKPQGYNEILRQSDEELATLASLPARDLQKWQDEVINSFPKRFL